ncbi:hypothetical protein BG28_14065 [Nesterenkonia sp. AN1]|uniref:cell division protein FtsQ/DivIB n=1 Tax=Nesterenkonia sp. AN1 TaxID=652017 RepID=UPI00045054CF|nr:hypothetical protein [Nesterenkonia sp. AN1]EXF25262.1 hypothetical protein BG28_14065 [Nesterenkonia sp. AN1]
MRLRHPRRASDRATNGDTGDATDGATLSEAESDGSAEESLLDFPEPAAVTGRRRRRRRILTALIALAVLLGVVATLYFSPLLVVRAIALQDNDLLTDQRAQELLAPLHGTPLAQISQRDVEGLLEEERAVDEVIVAARLPEGLDILVIEHPPVAEVHVEEEILFYSQEGELIRTFDEDQREDAQGYATPVISAEAALENESVFKTIVSVLGQLPEAPASPWTQPRRSPETRCSSSCRTGAPWSGAMMSAETRRPRSWRRSWAPRRRSSTASRCSTSRLRARR